MKSDSPPRSGVKRPSLSRTVWHNVESLPSQDQIERLISREVARAERNGQHFSLVLFRVKKGGRLGLNEKRLALTLLRRTRLTDEVGWFNEEHFCAILPDTSAQGAQIFADSVSELVARKGPRPMSMIYSFPFDWIDHDENETERPAPSNRQQDNRRGGRHDSPPGGKIFSNRIGLGDLASGGDDAFHPGNGHRGESNGDSSSLNRATSGATAVMERPTKTAVLPVLSPAATLEAVAQPQVKPVKELLVQRMPIWKRMIDLCGAATALLFLSPVLVIAAVAIKLTSEGPVIFRQRRAGLGGRPFTIYKFRTMCNDAEAKKKALRKFSEQDGPAFKLTRDPRVTRVGAFLRKSSVDELPQLFNVLLGHMSLVGPRPLPLDEQHAAETWQQRRLDVTPGLTCIWQIEGRSTVTFAEWVRMDVTYMRRRTMLHDIAILLKTVPAVLLRRGAR